MRKIFAIALLTLKEAYRRKVFLVLLIFAIALMSSSAFFPVMDAPTRIALVKIWSMRAITLFSALIAIFLAGVSIPSDVEERRIYMLVSKPVSKIEIFLGKFVGFALVVGIFILVTGILTVVYVKIVQLKSSEEVVLNARPQILADRVKRKEAERKEEEDLYRLVGNRKNSLIWVFSEIDSSKLLQKPEMEITVSVEDMRNDIAYTAYIEVKAINPVTNEEEMFKDIYVRSNTPYILAFPKDLVSKDGQLHVEISRKEVESLIWAKSTSVVIYESAQRFELNYIRGMGLVYLQTLIVLVASLMASTFLGGPVAIFFGIAVFFSGTIYDFVEASIKTAETLVANQKKNPSAYTRPEDIPVEVVEVSAYIAKASLKVIPNFKEFDFVSPLLENKWVSLKRLGEATLYGGIFILSFLVLGAFVMKAKDFS